MNKIYNRINKQDYIHKQSSKERGYYNNRTTNYKATSKQDSINLKYDITGFGNSMKYFFEKIKNYFG